jgi:hypothetical protein
MPLDLFGQSLPPEPTATCAIGRSPVGRTVPTVSSPRAAEPPFTPYRIVRLKRCQVMVINTDRWPYPLDNEI